MGGHRYVLHYNLPLLQPLTSTGLGTYSTRLQFRDNTPKRTEDCLGLVCRWVLCSLSLSVQMVKREASASWLARGCLGQSLCVQLQSYGVLPPVYLLVLFDNSPGPTFQGVWNHLVCNSDGPTILVQNLGFIVS